MRIDEEFKNLIPPLSDEEFKQLEENILKEGIREAIVVWDDPDTDRTIIDGHNRYAIAMKHSLPYNIRRMEFNNREEVILWMIDNQLGKRNLQKIDAVLLAQKKKEVFQRLAKTNQGNRTDITSSPIGEKVNTEAQIAKIANVGKGTVARVEQIQKKAPEKIESIRRGEMSINEAYRQVLNKEIPSGKKVKNEQLNKAKQEHQNFLEEKNGEVISFANAQADKENMKTISEGFLDDVYQAVKNVISLGKYSEPDCIEMIKIFDEKSKIDIAKSISKATKILCFIGEELVNGKRTQR